MDTSSLTDTTIEAIHTFACEPIHPAWVNELTTPIATAMAVLQLSGGSLVRVAPCEAELDEEQYPSLGLEVTECDATAFQWQAPSGKTHSMEPLVAATGVLPLAVQSITESDPLGEGAVSQLSLGGSEGSLLVFRHIMPPMTLGIELAHPGQAPKNSFKPKPLRDSA